MSLTPFEQLFAALEMSQGECPPGFFTDIQRLPEVESRPSPWETWTLIDLVRHHGRQQWLGKVVEECLESHDGGGVVPGIIDWEYRFHGIGCELTHRITGETIDVDFDQGTTDTIDVHFYKRYLRSVREPDAITRRVLDLHRNVDSIELDVIELFRQGMLVVGGHFRQHPELLEAPEVNQPEVLAGRFRLSQDLLDLSDLVVCFCNRWKDKGQQLWLAAVIGDWPLVAQKCSEGASCDTEFLKVAQSRTMECQRRRLDQIDRSLRHPQVGYLGLFALEDFHGPDVTHRLERALQGPISATTAKAMEIVKKTNDPNWCPHVVELLDRLDPQGEIPQPITYSKCLEFLFAQGNLTKHVIDKLVGAGDQSLDEATLLALEYVPSVALPLIRRGLRCDIPYVHKTVAAVLGILDRPWSRRELLAVLEEAREDETIIVYATALRESDDVACREAAMEVDEKYAKADSVLMDYARDSVSYEMQELHDRVMPLRRLNLSDG